MLALWAIMELGGDRAWLATVLLYGPRHYYPLPLVFLVPAALASPWRRSLLWPLTISAAVALGPLLDRCVPWYATPFENDARVTVLTLNAQRASVRPARLRELVERVGADVVLLQSANRRWDWPDGWQVRHRGELAIASRWPIVAVAAGAPRHDEPFAEHGLLTTVRAPFAEIAVASLYLPSPRQGLEAVIDPTTLLDLNGVGSLERSIAARRRGSRVVSERLAEQELPLLLGGDFNLTTNSRIFRKFWTPYTDAFSTAGSGPGFTKRTKVRWQVHGTRIDHILVDEHWRAVRAWVEEDVGSDHRPLVAEIVWDPGQSDIP